MPSQGLLSMPLHLGRGREDMACLPPCRVHGSQGLTRIVVPEWLSAALGMLFLPCSVAHKSPWFSPTCLTFHVPHLYVVVSPPTPCSNAVLLCPPCNAACPSADPSAALVPHPPYTDSTYSVLPTSHSLCSQHWHVRGWLGDHSSLGHE